MSLPLHELCKLCDQRLSPIGTKIRCSLCKSRFHVDVAPLHLANLKNIWIKVLTGFVMNVQILFFLLQALKTMQFLIYMMSSENKLEFQTKRVNAIFAQENFQKMHHLPTVQNVLAFPTLDVVTSPKMTFPWRMIINAANAALNAFLLLI